MATETERFLYKPVINTTRDRALFLMVFLSGAFFILFLKEISAHPVIPLLVGVSFIFFYFVCVMWIPLFRLSEERSGDSFYYLGLLFTLVSLGHTLWAFHGGGSDTTDIISGFGIALGTTVVGLLLRVIILQFRVDPIDVENEVRSELLEASNQLRDTLYSILQDMNTFRDGTFQSISEGMQSASNIALDSLNETTQKFSQESEKLVNRLDGIFGDFATNASEFAESSSKTAKALRNITTRIDKIEPPTDFVEAVFGPARDGMAAAAASMREAATEQQQQLEKIGTLVEVALKGADLIDRKITNLIDGTAGVEVSLEKISGFAENVSVLDGDLRRLIDATGGAIEGRVTDLTKVNDELSSSAETLAQTLRASAEEHKRSSADSAEASREAARINQKHSKEMETQAEQARVASKLMVDSLREMADAMAEKLG